MFFRVFTANPVGGHYNKARTVSENLKMSSALLSRFDLVFILLDEVSATESTRIAAKTSMYFMTALPVFTASIQQANEERDRLLSEHVMSLHSSRRRRGGVDGFARLPQTQAGSEAQQPLGDRLALHRGKG
jgi:DNA helicase MCM8